MTTKTVSVPKITCGHCVMTIEREVGELKGVSAVKADKDTKQVTVSWDAAATDWGSVAATLEEIGFPAVE
jgi:copper ion binding protein